MPKAKRIALTVGLTVFITLFSCEDFVQVDPPKTGLISETVFASDATATAAIAAIYVKLTGSFLGAGSSSLLVLNGFASDELMPAGASTEPLREFYNNNVTSLNTHISSIWSTGYNIIYQSNAVLGGLASSKAVTDPVRRQLEGEALFTRAYTHFHLVNLFGDIPYVTATDYRDNSKVAREPRLEIMRKVTEDLVQAKERLVDDYSFSKQERVRVNKWVAAGLLARAYLYMQDWANAELESTSLIDQQGLYELAPELDNVFLKGSREAIWQWMPGNPGQNAAEATYFILTGPPNIASLPDAFINQFETGDKRADRWVGSFTNGTATWYFPYKYKLKMPTASSEEYSVVMRLAEMYLIRAEARARQDKLPEAIADLDAIRARAGLASTDPSITRDDLLLAIERERRSELFTENDRWYDLTRTGRADAVIGNLKVTWQATDMLFPLPESELLINPTLKPQNPGY